MPQRSADSLDPGGLGATVFGNFPRRSALWMPLLIGGVATAVAATHTETVRRWIHRLRHSQAKAALRRATRLSQAVIGNDKHTIARVLGKPPSTVGATAVSAYLSADTWYYPLSKLHRIALAVTFEQDIARSATVLKVS